MRIIKPQVRLRARRSSRYRGPRKRRLSAYLGRLVAADVFLAAGCYVICIKSAACFSMRQTKAKPARVLASRS